MAYLEINKGKAVVHSPLQDEPMSIGRLPGNSIVINDPDISRRHCVIERWEGQFHIYDVGSRNGTVVNGQRVQRIELRPGDIITLGGTIAKFLDAPLKPVATTSRRRTWLIWAPALTVFVVAVFVVAWATGMLGRHFPPERILEGLGVDSAAPREATPATAPAIVETDSSLAAASGETTPAPSPVLQPSDQASTQPMLEPASEKTRYQWVTTESAAEQGDRLLGRPVAARFIGRPASGGDGTFAWELPPDGEITAIMEPVGVAAQLALIAAVDEPLLLEAELAGVLLRDRDGTRMVLRVGVVELQHALGSRDDRLQPGIRALLGRRIIINPQYTAESIRPRGN